MTTAVGEATWATSGDAGWRAWCDAIYNGITASGWVLVTDSGDRAVPAADTYPLANTYSYWIFRLDDPMQATAPVFMKFEVGRGTGTNNARHQITIGTGSNGAGTITGPVNGPFSHTNTGWTPSSTIPTSMRGCTSDDAGGAWFVIGGEELGGMGVYVFRTLADNGTPNDVGWLSVITLNSSSNSYEYFYDVGMNKTFSAAGVYNFPAALTSVAPLQSAGVAPVFPGRVWAQNRSWQVGGVYGGANQDFQNGTVVEIDKYSVPRNYMRVGSAGIMPFGGSTAGYSHDGMLLVWE